MLQIIYVLSVADRETLIKEGCIEVFTDTEQDVFGFVIDNDKKHLLKDMVYIPTDILPFRGCQ